MLFLINGLAWLVVGIMFFQINAAVKQKKYLKALGVFIVGIIAFVVVVALKEEFVIMHK